MANLNMIPSHMDKNAIISRAKNEIKKMYFIIIICNKKILVFVNKTRTARDCDASRKFGPPLVYSIIVRIRIYIVSQLCHLKVLNIYISQKN